MKKTFAFLLLSLWFLPSCFAQYGMVGLNQTSTDETVHLPADFTGSQWKWLIIPSAGNAYFVDGPGHISAFTFSEAAGAGGFCGNVTASAGTPPNVVGAAVDSDTQDGLSLGEVGITDDGLYQVVLSLDAGQYKLTIGGAAPPCLTNLSWTITNPQGAPGPVAYIAADNEGSTVQAAYSGYLVVDPGCTGQLMANGVPCSKAHNYSPVMLQPGTFIDSTGTPTTQQQAISDGECGAAAKTANIDWNNGCSIGQNISGTTCWPLSPTDFSGYPPNSGSTTGTNGGSGTSTNGLVSPSPYNYTGGAGVPSIVYNGTNGLSNLQQGDNGIYAAIVNASAQAHADQIIDQGLLGALGTNFGTGTNEGLSTTNLAQQNTLAGISNALSNIETMLTNEFSSNSINVPGYFTNYNGAQEFASAELVTALSGLNNNLGQMHGVGYTEGSDPVPDLTFQFHSVSGQGAIGNPMDFNPLHNSGVASIAQMVKKFFGWLLVTAYLIIVAKDSISAMKALSQAQQNHIPDAEVSFFGTGGNIAGLGLAVAGTAASLIGWAAVLAVISTWVANGVDVFDTFNANPLTGGPAGSVGLAEAFFPFATFFALLSSYIIWRFTSGIALLTVLAALRVIFG